MSKTPDLDVREVALLDDGLGIGGGLDVFGSHGWLGRSWSWMLAHLQPVPTLAYPLETRDALKSLENLNPVSGSP